MLYSLGALPDQYVLQEHEEQTTANLIPSGLTWKESIVKDNLFPGTCSTQQHTPLAGPFVKPNVLWKLQFHHALVEISYTHTSAKPISMGPPACLMELMGEAPVPPSWPDTCSAKAMLLVRQSREFF
eukprot:scaffold129951_cov19-Tisochrysis_lutea.AAC.3